MIHNPRKGSPQGSPQGSPRFAPQADGGVRPLAPLPYGGRTPSASPRRFAPNKITEKQMSHPGCHYGARLLDCHRTYGAVTRAWLTDQADHCQGDCRPPRQPPDDPDTPGPATPTTNPGHNPREETP